ncbi:uncharacterized protein LOC118744670 [Rhagoletis pomonella]|uniref:uncharacterized protein LOC118744670 n=1 Tax=Rhagoletis pomonella TaxID=28610 RepID=UPI0017823048|nr:uncharacterized protein LOC118744670 [Rhagoletis pomonella]
MSDDSMEGEVSSSSLSPEKRRSTVPNILPHQRSFEKRYSHMIHRQILETGVNKEALQRQINAYFSCGGGKASSSSTATAEDDAKDNVPESADRASETAENGAEEVNKAEGHKRSLDKAETIDVAEIPGAKATADNL